MVKKSTTKKGKSTLITLVILLVLFCSLAITIALFGPKEMKKAFFARSIGEAADSCEEEVIDYFGNRLISTHYDEISSRYEPTYKQYTVYYRISHTETINDLPTVKDSMAKCVVWESLGYVSDFNVFNP